jgi:hypothetical protein
MFAVKFDDFKRKVAKLDPPVELHKLTTCFVNTPEWNSYYSLWNAETNTEIHLEIEDDERTYTFFTINPTKKTKEKL